MSGSDLRCGAVSGLKTVKNPITLARRVMEKTPHIWLSGEGAEQFADQLGDKEITRCTQDYFWTQRRHLQLRDALSKQAIKLDHSEGTTAPTETTSTSTTALQATEPRGLGTVGAVSLDIHGNLAAATSTGGMTNKWVGRVGDTPTVGAGNYANAFVAVSGTGRGEQFLRHCVCKDVAAVYEYKHLSLQEACEEVVHHRLSPGDGGVIAVDANGAISMVFNSEGMFRGACTSKGDFEVKIWE